MEIKSIAMRSQAAYRLILLTALVVALFIPQISQAEARQCSLTTEKVLPVLVAEVDPATLSSPPPMDACTCRYIGKDRQHTGLLRRKYRAGIDIQGCVKKCVEAFLSSSLNQPGNSISRCTNYNNWTKF